MAGTMLRGAILYAGTLLRRWFCFRSVMYLWLVLGAGTSTAIAQSHNHANHCRALEPFTYVVSMSVMLGTLDQDRSHIGLGQLARRFKQIDRREIYTLLKTTGFNDKLPQVSLFLSDTAKYIDAFLNAQPAKADALLSSPRFQSHLSDMITIVNIICTAGIIDAKTGRDLTNSQGKAPSKNMAETAITAVTGAISSMSSDSKRPRGMSSEMARLMRVFLILLAAVSLLVIGEFIYRLSFALRLDRYNCNIPATAYIGTYQAKGTINVISRFGLSFVVDTPDNAEHSQHFEIDANVLFIIDKRNVEAIQSIAFDGSAGFRIRKKLDKLVLRELLKHSTTYPYRKIERRRKRKPPPPSTALAS